MPNRFRISVVAPLAVACCWSALPIAPAGTSKRAPLCDGSGYAGHLYYGLDQWRAELKAKPNNPHLMNETAIALRKAGRYEEAGELAQRLVALRKSTLGPDATEVARALNNLAVVYVDQGRYAEAEPLYQESLAIWRKQKGAEYCEVARVLYNLGILSHKLGWNTDAERYLHQSLALWQKNFGDEHPEFARAVGALGELYTDCGWYTAAEKRLLQALAIWEKRMGTDHPDYAICLKLLGALYKEQRQHADAESLYKESMAIWIAVMGDKHPEAGRVLKNISNLYVHREGVATNCTLSIAHIFSPARVKVASASWDAWRLTHFSAAQLADTSVSGMTASPHGDGVANLLKYALNLNPLTASTDGLPTLGQTNGFLTLTYTRRKPPTDLQYIVEAADNLAGEWSANGVSEVVLNDNGTLQTVVAADSVPIKDAPKRFLRLRVIWTGK